MEQHSRRPASLFHTLSLFSLICGVIGLISCCNPPLQLICGSSALILAYLSKNEKKLSRTAFIGMVLGALSVIASILIFLQYVGAMQLIEDPANNALIRDMYRRYQEIFSEMLPSSQPPV